MENPQPLPEGDEALKAYLSKASLSPPMMTVGRYAGKRIDQLPLSYLRWVMIQDFPPHIVRAAKEKVEASQYNSDYISISRHAIDMFSLRFLKRWTDYLEQPESSLVGIGTYVAKLAQEAWDKGKDVSKHRHQNDGIVKDLDGMRFVYAVSPEFPDYKEVITIMSKN